MHWTDFRSYLADLGLDTYAGYDRIVAFAPKSRLNIRRVALLHPFDLLFFTALVLALRDDITVARLPRHENRVFSYRAEGAAPEIPAISPESDAFSKDLKHRGFSFVGSTIVYAHMQAVGMVNDHLVDCYSYREIREN